jgi:hypothetical protein
MTGYYEEYADVMLTAPATSDTYNMSYDADLFGLNWIRSPGYLPDILIQERAIGYGGDIYSPLYAIETWYSRNDSIQPGPGIIPYNSTVTYNNQTINFEAPWIKLGSECAPHNTFFTDVGQCVCYKDQPLPYDLFSSNYIHCVNKSGYAWGFSSFVVLLGLCFLSAWLFGCWAIWLDANINSVLVKNRKRTYGSLRTSIDLVESVKRDLGDRTYSLSDGQLKKELDKCDDIGYSVIDGDVLHIGLMTGTLKERPTESSINNVQLYS